MAEAFLSQIKSRRTHYEIKRKSPISDDRLLEIAREVIKHSPSSFNCQSTRIVILLRDEHDKFWEIAKQCFEATLSEAVYKEYEKKLIQRQAGYGTILLFEDLDVIRDYQVRFPRFTWHLLDFSESNNAISAFNLWTALSLEGLGCNLQHVNPIVDQRLLSEWKILPTWSLKAQLVFGSPTGEPNPHKTFIATEDRVFVHGMDGDTVEK